MNGPDPAREELESKLTFLEHTLDTLGEVLLDHGNLIDTLRARVDELEQRIGSLAQGEGAGESSGGDPLVDERPPHY